MKKMLLLAAVIVCILFAGISTARIQQQDRQRDRDYCCVCEQFVDADGDGICDLCDGCIPLPKGEDDDGDGIPNGQDDDYVPPKDGSGK